MRLALYPAHPSAPLDRALALAGLSPEPVGEHGLDKPDVANEWSALILELGDEPLRRLRAGRRIHEDTGLPLLLVVESDQVAILEDEIAAADFIINPAEPNELRVRVRRMVTDRSDGDIQRYRELELNTATYQATIDGVPIDLTYMEYELLRYFVENQGRVWSREQLLSKVWGYEYFGGARTVDVHVRRLRSKIGEERAGWITTVRSVGYRFG